MGTFYFYFQFINQVHSGRSAPLGNKGSGPKFDEGNQD